MKQLPWPCPPTIPPLELKEVHLWQRSLMAPDPEREQLWSVLSADEQQRAQRFVKVADRHGFAIARGTLRQLLGYYLETDPGALTICYGDRGKPQLVQGENPLDLRFNLSHSHGLALYAITLGTDIGVDLEQLNPRIDYEGITRRFFSTSEQQALFQLPTDQRNAAFFQIWTRKEACIKAMGGSIAMGLDQFDGAIALDHPTTSVELVGEDGQALHWWVMNLKPKASYLGALALSTPPQTIHYWQWSSELA